MHPKVCEICGQDLYADEDEICQDCINEGADEGDEEDGDEEFDS